MIEGLKPYPAYQDLKQMWFGNIPAHWKVVPSKSLFRHRKEKTRADDEMLTASQAHGIIQRDKFMAIEGRRVMHVFVGGDILKHVEPNDFVMSMRSFQGGLEWSKVRGAISSAYVMLTPNEHVHPPYFHFLLKTPAYIAALRRTSDLVRDGQALRYANFGQVPLPRVPPDEQAAIVRFLDHANRKIDAFLRAKRKLIALLGEQKQAIIHRAVTRGLDPNAPLKPSGIPWLGEIPKHWEIVRNMALFSHRVDSGIAGLPVLQVSLRSGITAEELDQFGRPKRLIADATKYKLLRKGDIAYNTMRMWQGAVGVAPSDGLVSPAYVVIKPRADSCPEFYDFIFHTEVYKQQVNRQSTGIVSDRNRLYWDSFKQMPNLKLPRIEQEEIVAFMTSETGSLNTAIARTEREIALMQEYRTRLTADVVTGKLDVRPAAANLPDLSADAVAPEPLAEDESPEELDTEEG